jgi:hypothetical protein
MEKLWNAVQRHRLLALRNMAIRKISYNGSMKQGDFSLLDDQIRVHEVKCDLAMQL